jgi:uncharacterized protein YdeI (YjbR/CyaY-like superfamily)
MPIEDGVPIASPAEFESWLARNGQTARECWAVVHKKTSANYSVSIAELIESGLCWGWVDHQTKRIDDARYGIRFVPRRPGSNWSARNRAIGCRLIAEGRMRPVGMASLPPDFVCPE